MKKHDIELKVKGEVFYYDLIYVGGKDDEGEYEIFLDEGPVQGERYYYT